MCRHPPPKQAGVILRWGGDGGHGHEQAGPDLPGIDAGAQQVVVCLVHLVAEGAGRVRLKAMTLLTLGGPETPCSASQKKNFTLDATLARHSSLEPSKVVQPMKNALYTELTEYWPSVVQHHTKWSASNIYN
jgi:hypothetical protein